MKKFTTMAICFVLIACMVAGGSLAYLTDRDSEANVFTVGDVRIELSEDFEQGAKLTPGVDIEKAPKITNTGVNDAWVWAQIAMPKALDNIAPAKNVIHFNFSEDSVKDGQWKWNEDSDWSAVPTTKINEIEYNVYTVLYQTVLKPGETTTYPAMTKVYMDKFVDIDPEGNWYKVEAGVANDLGWNTNEDGAPIIYVSAYGIQAEGFDTVQDAFDAYGTQWGDKGAEWADVTVAKPASGATRPAGYEITETSGVTTVIEGVTVLDGSDEETNLRALYKEGGITESMEVKDSVFDGTYAMNLTTTAADKTLNFENTTFMGWVSYDGFKSVTFADCTFKINSEATYNYLRAYDATVFENCEFAGTTLDITGDGSITLKNCIYNGELIESVDDLTLEEGVDTSKISIENA